MVSATSMATDPYYASPDFGNLGGKREFISREARAVLVEKVLTRATSENTRAALKEVGVKRSITGVMLWMRCTRRWLGLPPVYPSKISDRYREAVDGWISENGFPTKEEIMNGWLPGKKDRDGRREDDPGRLS